MRSQRRTSAEPVFINPLQQHQMPLGISIKPSCNFLLALAGFCSNQPAGAREKNTLVIIKMMYVKVPNTVSGVKSTLKYMFPPFFHLSPCR